MDQPILDRLRAIIHADLMGDPNRITPSASFRDDLGADSLESIGLVVAMEHEFSIEITDDEADGIETVGDAQALIERKVGGSSMTTLEQRIRLFQAASHVEPEPEPRPIPLIIIWVPLLIASWGAAAGVGYGLWMAARAVIG
jgi:acyl carrier protein